KILPTSIHFTTFARNIISTFRQQTLFTHLLNKEQRLHPSLSRRKLEVASVLAAVSLALGAIYLSLLQ
ncbi:hypothetical protein, partial [Alloprevotella tannerae]|uniref:hypothetical protein n=1 Tax=Alloprevotella tannerae TaxID=76122 RepID=UPI003C6FFEC0